MTRRAALVDGSAILATASTARAEPTITAPATINSAADTWARDFNERIGAPALSLALAGREGMVWRAAFGMADLELSVPATIEHSFRLGSVSKILTATAAARLASRALVELDVPIAYWLPDLPQKRRATTLRQLLTHRGGVRHYLPKDLAPDAPGGPIYNRGYPTDADRLALFIDDPLVARPGERVSYSSYGYTLASIVMQTADGRPFLQILADEIGAPFGMASLLDDDPFRVIPRRAKGYIGAADIALLHGTENDEPPKLQGRFENAPWLDQSYCWAGAGMRATVADLAAFGSRVLDTPESPLTAEERALLFTPITDATEASPPLGLGWRVDRDARGRTRWHHAGATPGGRCALVIFPDEGLSVALASNTMTIPGDVLGPARELADCFV